MLYQKIVFNKIIKLQHKAQDKDYSKHMQFNGNSIEYWSLKLCRSPTNSIFNDFDIIQQGYYIFLKNKTNIEYFLIDLLHEKLLIYSAPPSDNYRFHYCYSDQEAALVLLDTKENEISFLYIWINDFIEHYNLEKELNHSISSIIDLCDTECDNCLYDKKYINKCIQSVQVFDTNIFKKIGE